MNMQINCAERTLEFGSVGVVITITNPVVDESGENYVCTASVVGGGSDDRHDIFGVDSLQCLVLALRHLSSRLYGSEMYKSGHLLWEAGMDKSDLGLPTHLQMGGYEEEYI